MATLEPGVDLDATPDRASVGGRAVLDRELIHIEDLMAVAADRVSRSGQRCRAYGCSHGLAAPLLREGVAIGAILIRRTEVRPFTESKSTSSKPSPIKP